MARLSSAGLLGTLGLSKTSVPKVVGLRFGTVLSVSRGQRTDLGAGADGTRQIRLHHCRIDRTCDRRSQLFQTSRRDRAVHE